MVMRLHRFFHFCVLFARFVHNGIGSLVLARVPLALPVLLGSFSCDGRKPFLSSTHNTIQRQPVPQHWQTSATQRWLRKSRCSERKIAYGINAAAVGMAPKPLQTKGNGSSRCLDAFPATMLSMPLHPCHSGSGNLFEQALPRLCFTGRRSSGSPSPGPRPGDSMQTKTFSAQRANHSPLTRITAGPLGRRFTVISHPQGVALG
jgi:hypothetical protein